MAKEMCTFHHNHGLNIRLLEDRTVAQRVDSYDNGIVFTEQPIPSGYIFQVEVIKKSDQGYPGSLRIGVTTQSPDKAKIPSDGTVYCSKSDYWILTYNQAYNSDFVTFLNFSLANLLVGQSVGVSVTTSGKLYLYVDGKFHSLVWKGMPTDEQYWGVADIYGSVSSIKSTFICC